MSRHCHPKLQNFAKFPTILLLRIKAEDEDKTRERKIQLPWNNETPATEISSGKNSVGALCLPRDEMANYCITV